MERTGKILGRPDRIAAGAQFAVGAIPGLLASGLLASGLKSARRIMACFYGCGIMPIAIFVLAFLSETPTAEATDPPLATTNSSQAERALNERDALLSVQLLDNWKPEAWYRASHNESVTIKNADVGCVQQVQFREEVLPIQSSSTSNPSAKSVASSSAPYQAKPIGSLGIDIGRNPGLTPLNRAVEDGVFDDHPSAIAMRTWPITTRTWTAPKTRHRPLYFEEVNAERYGYTCSRFFQPVISSVHFFGTVPYLPYLMTANPPCQCNYTLGHYRPGSCPPYRKHSWPISVKGAGVEAAIAIGMIALIP